MPSKYTFTPLYGANNEGPMCSVLQIYILLDCGWDDRLDEEMLAPIQPYVEKLNAVLISHPDFSHIGGLPYIYSKWKCNAPIFINADASKIAIFAMEDAYENRLEGEETCIFGKADVNYVASCFRQVVYNQRESINSKEGFTVYVNAREAGHSVGGAIWDIQTETDSLIYSMNMNPLSDNHLRGAVYKPLGNTSILITDSCGDMSDHRVDYRQLEKTQYSKFSYLIIKTLRDKKGNVLIPVESTGRCLEIILMLERIWEESRLDSFKVYFLTKHNITYVTHIRGISSNLSDKLQQQAIDEEREPFELHHITCSPGLENILANESPKVVLASMGGLETSYSQLLLKQWCEKTENLLLFVTTPPPDTLASRILNCPKQNSFSFINRMRIRLMGDELDQKLREIEAQRAQLKEEKKEIVKTEEEDDDNFDDVQVGIEGVKHQTLFPYVNDDVKYDEYGIVLPDYIPVLQSRIDELDNDDDDDEFDEEDETTEYCKYKVTTEELEVKCQRDYIDFNGLADYSTLHGAIREINPNHIILWHGHKKQKEFLYSRLISDNKYDVQCCNANDHVTITSDHSVVIMKLDETLLNGLKKEMIGDYEVCRAIACVEEVQEPNNEEKELALTITKKHLPLVAPVALRTDNLGMRKIYDVLRENNMDATMNRDRIEIQNREIMIRTENETLVVEGNVSVEFQKVQQLLNEQYRIV